MCRLSGLSLGEDERKAVKHSAIVFLKCHIFDLLIKFGFNTSWSIEELVYFSFKLHSKLQLHLMLQFWHPTWMDMHSSLLSYILMLRPYLKLLLKVK
jgi:hypothetical protein